MNFIIIEKRQKFYKTLEKDATSREKTAHNSLNSQLVQRHGDDDCFNNVHIPNATIVQIKKGMITSDTYKVS